MQEPKAGRLGERTVDYGLAAMDFCGTLPRTAAGRHVAACGRIVPATVSPDERSEESPKAMSIRGAASSQRPVGRGLPSASHWTLNCWTLAAETLRSEATPNGCCSRRGLRQARPSSRCVPNRGNCC